MAVVIMAHVMQIKPSLKLNRVILAARTQRLTLILLSVAPVLWAVAVRVISHAVIQVAVVLVANKTTIKGLTSWKI